MEKGTVRLYACLFCIAVTPGLFASGNKETLTIGLMPAINSIPLIVAEHNGYFDDEGVEVTLVMFKSQMYRETALQAGEIDGTISDMINAAGAVSQGFPLAVTSVSDGDFALMTAPGCRIRTLKDWNRVEGKIRTGLLENSIVYYVTERMLERKGSDPAKVELVSTLILTARLEMRLAGQLEAACLPEPVATLAEQAGAYRICDTTILPGTPGVILFSKDSIEMKGREISAFYRAYNRAVADLNQDYERYRDVIIEKGEFPPSIRDSFTLPRFSPARVPTREETGDVVAWMLLKGLLERTLPYESVVDGRFIP